jgi:hypothetical protein
MKAHGLNPRIKKSPFFASTLKYGWISALWARNFMMMSAITTCLHLWLYRWRKQGQSNE